jgi:hypothetical protein
MKTRVYQLSHLLFSLSLCFGFQSCNKEDFYQKEFLDNPFKDSPVTTGSVNNGSQAGDIPGTSSGSQGGANGTSTGGATGSTTGNSTGSTTGGQTTGGQTTGGAAGSTDGSVTSGSSTGSASGGVNGSTTSGSATGGQGTGGVDGTTTSGSSTGGTTTGGTTTGGTTTMSCSTSPTSCILETFKQAVSQTKKIDIVWIIDNSGSMADEQMALGQNFSAFIDDFITKNVDFKMAITTTDTSTSYLKGFMVPGSDTKLTSAKAALDESQFKTDFNNLVKVGITGSGYEKGLEASEGFMQKYAASFLRADAYLAVVLVSDEEDQSPKTPTAYTDYLKSFKSQAGLVKFYTIADINKTNSGYGISTGADRYTKASSETGGVIADIRNDFYHNLSDMGDSIINLLDSFALANSPVTGSMIVYVNNVETTDYTYDAETRSIRFDVNKLPPVGAEIKVLYRKQ